MEINFQKQDIAGNLGYVWSLTSGDTGDVSLHSGTADRTVQVGGTFGATGNVVVEGSLNGTEWHTLRDTFGDPLSFSAPGLRAVLENVVYVRPRVTAGDGTTAINVTLNVRR